MSSKRSPKGMPEPHQLSDGTWEVRLRYTLVPHGKQYSIRFRDKKKSEVIKQLKAFDPHKDHVKRAKVNVTVSEYAWEWMRTFKYPNLQPTSYDKIESTFIHHIEPAVGMIRLKNLTSKDIQTIINNMKAHPYSYSTVKKVYDFFNMLLRHAEKENDIDRNPMVSVVMPERKLFQKKEIRFFDEKELEKINAEAMREDCGVHVNPENDLFILMENTGIRRGEVVGMMKTHIDWKNCRLHIRCNIQTCKKRDEMGNAVDGREEVVLLPKSDCSYRTIPLNKTALEALKRLCDTHPESEWVACMPDGSRMTLDRLERDCTKLLKNAGVKPAGLHAFRHTFASKLISMGANVNQVSKLMGHSSVKITLDYYAHLFPNEDLAVVSMLDKN